jgi:hypothetical protein
MEWRSLGSLSGAQADALRRAQERGSAITRLLRERIEAPVLEAWGRLPLIVRTEIRCSAKGKAAAMPADVLGVVDIAPPRPDESTLGRQGSFMLLDVRGARPQLTIVLYDWDDLTIDSDALTRFGIHAEALGGLLMQHVRPSSRVGASARWSVRVDPTAVRMLSGLLDSDDVSPVVGRFALGDVPWARDRLAVEVLALPRLSPSRPRSGRYEVLGDPLAARAFLERTVWRRGTPGALLALLKLAHGASLTVDQDKVTLTATDDPSPLAWIALASTLEEAADFQRRQYVRRDDELATPTGTLRFNAYAANVARLRPQAVPVTRYVLSYDCLENRLFRGVAQTVRRLLNADDGVGAWMSERYSNIERVFDRAEPVVPELWMCKAVLDREPPAPIAEAVRQCERLLAGRYAGIGLDSTEFCRARSFELDIAKLFEAAMRGVVASSSRLKVRDGNVTSTAHALRWEGAGCGPNNLYPDILLMDGERVIALGDAKYKRPDQQSSYRPLRREDFQQLCTYMLAWPAVQRAVVLIPEDNDEGSGSRLVATLRVGGDRELAVFAVAAERWVAARRAQQPLTVWLRGVTDLPDRRWQGPHEEGTVANQTAAAASAR